MHRLMCDAMRCDAMRCRLTVAFTYTYMLQVVCMPCNVCAACRAVRVASKYCGVLRAAMDVIGDPGRHGT